jgi:hypothetical protein
MNSYWLLLMPPCQEYVPLMVDIGLAKNLRMGQGMAGRLHTELQVAVSEGGPGFWLWD